MRENELRVLTFKVITEAYYGSLRGTRILIRPRNFTMANVLNETLANEDTEEFFEQAHLFGGLCNVQCECLES